MRCIILLRFFCFGVDLRSNWAYPWLCPCCALLCLFFIPLFYFSRLSPYSSFHMASLLFVYSALLPPLLLPLSAVPSSLRSFILTEQLPLALHSTGMIPHQVADVTSHTCTLISAHTRPHSLYTHKYTHTH